MTDRSREEGKAQSPQDIVELAQAEEEAGVVDQQTIASAAIAKAEAAGDKQD